VPVEFLEETRAKGVVERRFDLAVDGETVPGIMWSPDEADGERPTILVGHGGTQHKRTPNVLGLARRYVRHLGYAAVALDAPDHGDRVTDPDAADAARRNLQRRMAAGRREGAVGVGLDPAQAEAFAARHTKGVREWRALLDALPAVGLRGPFGYWGVSMGTAIGLPFVASEPRVAAAVLGLAGLRDLPGRQDLDAAARALTIPVLFLFQWDDELMTRESGLALFDAFGSREKSMHVNPGGHVEIPLFERDAAEAFFARHLGVPAEQPE
jgi:dienelactone hydrolase